MAFDLARIEVHGLLRQASVAEDIVGWVLVWMMQNVSKHRQKMAVHKMKVPLFLHVSLSLLSFFASNESTVYEREKNRREKTTINQPGGSKP